MGTDKFSRGGQRFSAWMSSGIKYETGYLAANGLALLAVILVGTHAATFSAAGEPKAYAAGPPITDPQPPRLTESQKEYLSRLARRTLRDGLLGRGAYAPEYVPEALSTISAEVVLRVWHGGYLSAGGVGRFGPIVEATREAALMAVETLKPEPPEPDVLRVMTIDIEAAGPAEAVPYSGDWTAEGALRHLVEPGVHGLAFLGPRAIRRVYPSKLLHTDLTQHEMLAALAQTLSMVPAEITETRLERFRSTHWFEAGSGAEIRSLHRGLIVLPISEVRPDRLAEATARIAEYLAYRQLDSGLFSYQFEPGNDRYVEGGSPLAHAGATAALAMHAKVSGRSASKSAAELGIRFHLQGLTASQQLDDAAFIATADGENKLGLTALVALALAEHPEPQAYADTRLRLAKGMLSLQRPSGMFLTAFPPAVRLNEQDYFPGEALLALAAEQAIQPSDEIVAAFDKAIEFYRVYFRARRSPALVPWQVQAFARMGHLTGRSDFAEYVFELTDWLLEEQLTGENCPWPELLGGISPTSPGEPDISTALYLQAASDALLLARDRGEAPRIRKYELAVRAAARFVMQLQVRPEEVYFVRSPRDAVYGVRGGPALNRLRIDYCQHALIGLIKARQALYPDAS